MKWNKKRARATEPQKAGHDDQHAKIVGALELWRLQMDGMGKTTKK
tara:strand:- start:506 stop:643 length:138 start_codon:yes stop_codon:yes gene_type:complete